MQSVAELTRLSAPVLKYVRRGLGFSRFDLSDYECRMSATTEKAQATLTDLQNSVNASIK